MPALPELLVLGAVGAAVIAAFALLLSAVGDLSWKHPRNRAWAMIATGIVEFMVGALLAAGRVRLWPAAVMIALAGVVLVASGARHLGRVRSSTSREANEIDRRRT